MDIKPYIPFIPNAELEARAYSLIDQYHREVTPVLVPPVPVEEIIDFLLKINLDWAPIPDTDEEPILAYIEPKSKTIRLNERRRSHFEQYPGALEFTMAHELGHHELHLTEGNLAQLQFECGEIAASPRYGYLCRNSMGAKDMRELQAERFASYLVLPSHLLLPAIQNLDLLQWANLYRLRDAFRVSITALRIRLEGLGLIYVAPGRDHKLFRSKAEAEGQLRLL